jgi:hypothetical protein
LVWPGRSAEPSGSGTRYIAAQGNHLVGRQRSLPPLWCVIHSEILGTQRAEAALGPYGFCACSALFPPRGAELPGRRAAPGAGGLGSPLALCDGRLTGQGALYIHCPTRAPVRGATSPAFSLQALTLHYRVSTLRQCVTRPGAHSQPPMPAIRAHVRPSGMQRPSRTRQAHQPGAQHRAQTHSGFLPAQPNLGCPRGRHPVPGTATMGYPIAQKA